MEYAHRMVRQMDDENAWCPTCQDSFESISSMCYHHNKRHTFELRQTAICENCDDSFVPSNITNPSKYCSEYCFGQGTRAELVEIECENCSDTFKVLPAYSENRRFCSNSCANSGEYNANWIDGRSEGRAYYGSNWRSIREKVLNRDDYCCTNCGMTVDQHYDTYGLSLDVHHKERLANFDNPEDANQMDNLTSLCKSCHKKIERGNT